MVVFIKKKIFIYFSSIILIFIAIYLVFHNDLKGIVDCLKTITIIDVIILIGVGTVYQLLEAFGCHVLLKSQIADFKYVQVFELTLLGTFCNVITSTAGTIPIQSYYLYKQGVNAGKGIGLLILDSIFHKLAVFVYATVVLLFTFNDLANNSSLKVYIIVGYLVYLVIIVGLVLLCSASKIQQLLLFLIDHLPDRPALQKRKNDWKDNLNALYLEAKHVLHDHKTCLKVILADFLKLIWTYTIPFICLMIIDDNQLTFIQVQMLSSLMLLITGVLPNLAGMGSAELAFMLLFIEPLGLVKTTMILLLYRLATYFYPFILSIVVVLKLEKKLLMKFDK